MAHPTPEMPDVKEKRKKLLADIDYYCERYKAGEQETVLIVGRTGVGKSAAINTIAKIVNGTYFPIAKMGEGAAATKTKELLTYKNCGVRMDLRRKPTDTEEDEIFERITPHLPHLIDYAGLDDVDTLATREIFDLLIAGFIPPGTPVEVLEKDQKKYGVGSLKSIYDKARPEWKVTKIVFVHSCLTSVPKALINCLLSTVSSVEEGKNVMKYTGDIFLLITKYDLVDPNLRRVPNHSEAGDSGSQQQQEDGLQETSSVTREAGPVSMEDFNTIEDTLARLFTIKGALEHNRLRWTSYHSGTGYDNENIDNIALEFIRQMVMPGGKREAIPPDTPWLKRMKLEICIGIEDAFKSLNLSKRDLLSFVVAVAVLLAVGWLLNLKPSK